MKKRFFCFVLAAAIALGYTVSAAGTEATASGDNSTAITAQTAILADANTGQIYYQKDMHKRMYPASITKILTGLVAIDKGNPNDILTIPDGMDNGMPSGSAGIALQTGEQITEDEALYTMFLASANDSATALALHTAGTVPAFVNMMNDYAKSLGVKDSTFDNPTGLPDKNNLTSAYDMAVITRKAYGTPELMKYFGALKYTMPATNKRAKPQNYVTLHKMMKSTRFKYPGVIAGKTGWETMSGHTLVTVAQRNDRTLVCVVMRSSDANTVYGDTASLLNYGFSHSFPSEGAAFLPSCTSKADISKISNKSSAGPSTNNAPKAAVNGVLIAIACIVGVAGLIVLFYFLTSKIARIRGKSQRT